MKLTQPQTSAQTFSEEAIVLIAQPRKKQSASAAALAKLNAELNAMGPQLKKLARANTKRLTGKSQL